MPRNQVISPGCQRSARGRRSLAWFLLTSKHAPSSCSSDRMQKALGRLCTLLPQSRLNCMLLRLDRRLGRHTHEVRSCCGRRCSHRSALATDSEAITCYHRVTGPSETEGIAAREPPALEPVALESGRCSDQAGLGNGAPSVARGRAAPGGAGCSTPCLPSWRCCPSAALL